MTMFSYGRVRPGALAFAFLAISTALPIEAAAQNLFIQFSGGRVTLRAENVSIRQILGRWAKVGGATFVNGDQVPDILVTLWLDTVAEDQALATLLRDVGGYILAGRPENSSDGASINRILILPARAASELVTASQTARIPSEGPSFPFARENFPPSAQRAPAVVNRIQQQSATAAGRPQMGGGSAGSEPIAVGANAAEDMPGVVSNALSGPHDGQDASRYKNMFPVQAEPAPDPNAKSVGANPFGIKSGTIAPSASTPRPQNP